MTAHPFASFVSGLESLAQPRGGGQPIYSPPAYPGEARVAGGAVLPEERPRMTPPLLQCDPCVSVRAKKKLAVEIILISIQRVEKRR